MKSDNEISRDVGAELHWAPDLDETDIAVNVTNGVVALTGFVHSFADKRNAEKAAKRINGVTAVANDIAVRLPSSNQLTDPEIARNLSNAIRAVLPLAHEDVKAVVEDGRVTLDGMVNWEFQREDVELAVRRQLGVRSVVNAVKLRRRVFPGDVRHRIQSALVRSAQLDARSISVEAHDGAVVLGGKVRSWAEREEVQRAAWAAPGVLEVKNNITVGAA